VAIEANITRDDGFYLGEDKRLRVTIYTSPAKTECVDVGAFAMSYKMAQKPGQAAVVTKTTGAGISVGGVFNSSPALNTQVVEIALDDVDTDAIAAQTWYHELKRTDNNLEGILFQGRAALLAPLHTS
jgi:hypothetical protein